MREEESELFGLIEEQLDEIESEQMESYSEYACYSTSQIRTYLDKLKERIEILENNDVQNEEEKENCI